MAVKLNPFTGGLEQVPDGGSSPVVIPNIIHVETNGNDTTGDGSFAKPYLTAQKGFDIQAGDRSKLVNFGVGAFGSVTLQIINDGITRVYNYRGAGFSTVIPDLTVIDNGGSGSSNALQLVDTGVHSCYVNQLFAYAPAASTSLLYLVQVMTIECTFDFDLLGTDYSANPISQVYLIECKVLDTLGAGTTIPIVTACTLSYVALPVGSTDVANDGNTVTTNRFTGRGTAVSGAVTSNPSLNLYAP